MINTVIRVFLTTLIVLLSLILGAVSAAIARNGHDIIGISLLIISVLWPIRLLFLTYRLFR